MTQLAQKNSETVEQVQVEQNINQTADKSSSSNFVSSINKIKLN